MGWQEQKIGRLEIGFMIFVISAVVSSVMFIPTVLVTQAQAAQEKAQVAALVKRSIDQEILDLEVQIVRLELRDGLSEEEKYLSLKKLDRQLESLEKIKECLDEGRIDCI